MFKTSGASIPVCVRAVLSLEGFQLVTRCIVSFCTFFFFQEGLGISMCIELARNKAGIFQLFNCMAGFI